MKLELNCGVQVSLLELRQYVTYEGLMEGLPTAERNKGHIRSLLNDPSNHLYEVSPYLIAPSEKPLEYIKDKPYPFGTPSALPSITCVARFESLQPTAGGSGDFSGLVVIWFQDDFAFPIHPAIAAQLKAIDWNSHAGNYEY